MSDPITLPDDENALSDLYNQTVEAHNSYLEKLHAAFDKRCEQIGDETKKKLAKVPDTDADTKNQILKEEQELLDKTLAELKYAINKSNANARKKLEEIENKLDSKGVNLEQELANL